jgi:hypothetical protein
MTTSTAERGQPWARACGLLVSCGTTLAGVLQQVDPDVILTRATVSGIAVTSIVAVFRSIVPRAHLDDADED